MRQEVERQLERLFTRIEFNEGFELDVIAPKTWAAQWWARWVLEDRLAGSGGFEILELELQGEVSAPARVLAESISRTKERRILLVHLLDDGSPSERWQPFFRRLNEVRNAVVREFVGNLVILVPPRLLVELAGDAPDLWSVSAVQSVGGPSHEQLVETMAVEYAMLDHLTLMGEDESVRLLRQHALGRFVGPVGRSVDSERRARCLFELLADQLEAPALGCRRLEELDDELSVDWDSGNLWLGYDNFRGYTAPVGWVIDLDLGPDDLWDMSHSWWAPLGAFDEIGVSLCPGSPGRRDLESLIHARQAIAHVTPRCCIMHHGDERDPAETFARSTHDLVIVVPAPGTKTPRWSFEPGTSSWAPKLYMGSNVKVAFAGGQAMVRLIEPGLQLGGPIQPWLPGLDPDLLGSMATHR